MMPQIRNATLAAAVILVSAILASAENDEQTKKAGRPPERVSALRDGVPGEPGFQGKPLSYWIGMIRDRNEDGMPIAFTAIRYLGPDAKDAVPALINILAAPFTPIDLGRDSDESILSKLFEIEVRSEAIDTLASIGEAASAATLPMIDWAVAVSVIPSKTRSAAIDERFIDLFTLDVVKRIQTIIAIAEFGDAAVPALTGLLKSGNPEKRKLAVAILGEEALTIATELLRSRDCDEARLGITILNDMEPVVARVYLAEFSKMLVCYAN